MKISTLRQIQLSQVSNVDKNNKETYISHADQLLRNASYAKKSVWGIYSITYTAKKISVEHLHEMPSLWDSSAMPCHCTQNISQALHQ